MNYARRVEVFEQLRAKYVGLLESVLWKLTSDRELFAEALQYALLAMWRKLDKLNSEKVSAYIYRIAQTSASKAWRNRIGKDGQITHIQPRTKKTPSDKLCGIELADKVRHAIAQLPSKQAAAIVMRYLEQKDYQAVSQKLNCSPATARSHVSKALATLKNKLAVFEKKVQ